MSHSDNYSTSTTTAGNTFGNRNAELQDPQWLSAFVSECLCSTVSLCCSALCLCAFVPQCLRATVHLCCSAQWCSAFVVQYLCARVLQPCSAFVPQYNSASVPQCLCAEVLSSKSFRVPKSCHFQQTINKYSRKFIVMLPLTSGSRWSNFFIC